MKHNRDPESSCRTCEHATLLSEEEYCLCRKKGVVFSHGSCRRFSPDLLKFAPSVRLNADLSR